MDITKYLKQQGHDTVPGSFYRLIDVWESWYKSKVNKFHTYRIYNGDSYVNQQRYSLGMAKKVSEDIADLLMNEKVVITINDASTQTFVDKVLKQNHAERKLNEYQERKAYTGTVAYVPYLDGIEVDDYGKIIPGTGEIKINYVSGSRIYPISWENGYISECAFVFYRTISSKKYAQIQVHSKTNEEYVITNHIVECSSGTGREIPQKEWENLKGFEFLVPEVCTGSGDRQFVIDTLGIVNNTDEDNPMGVSIFANCIDQLKGLDVVYDSYINEFVLGKKRIFVTPEMLNTNADGNPVFDDNDIVFYRLPDEMKGTGPITEVNMTIRAEEHNQAINDGLNIISSKCGFGTEHYKFENGTLTTATEVISENSDMFRALKKHEIPLEDTLKELVKIVCRLGAVIGEAIKEDAEATVDFDDSIIEDKASDMQKDREDVAMGAMAIWEYRKKHYNEDEKTAKENVPGQFTTIPDDEPIEGGPPAKVNPSR